MQTKNGIELDLSKSNYKYKLNDYVFYFSSQNYLNKFKDEVTNFVIMENKKIEIRYKIIINLSIYLIFALYKRIEKRGFYVTYKGEIIRNNDLRFVIKNYYVGD